MGQANDAFYQFLLLVIIIYLLTLCSFPVPSNSLTIKLIRRDEIDSNLFPKNFSDAEKHQIYADLGHSRALRLSEQALRYGDSLNLRARNPINDTISPKISQMLDSIFVVPFMIGSGRYYTYLLLDTGSSYTWLQCKGCSPDCFHVRGALFDPSLSSSYRALSSDSPLCRRQLRNDDVCRFLIEYVGTKVEGISSLENIVFTTKARTKLTVPNVVLGCAFSAPRSMFRGNDGPNNPIAGIFGLSMGLSRDSFMVVTQSITKWKFSYCLPPWSDRQFQTDLLFGDDVQPLPRLAQTIPMQTSQFFVTLHDISVAGKKLHLNPEWFRWTPHGGGFVLDTGSALTFLAAPAYDKVRAAYVQYFKRYMQPVSSIGPYDLCYSWPLPHKHRPSMAYHFKNADLNVQFWNSFQRVKDSTGQEFVCMAIQRDSHTAGISILGAVQQANYRFVHNLRDQSLSFYHEKCGGK